jgi:hypothetical protein
MSPADPPAPPEEPAQPPAPPELPPDSPPPPAQTPTTMGPDSGAGAKPSEPGPIEPPGIAKSVLPERQEDAARADDPVPGKAG